MDILHLQKDAQKKINECASLTELEQLHIAYLGKNGEINKLLQNIKNLSLEEKKTAGKQINELKQALVRFLSEKKISLTERQSNETRLDATLPGTPFPHGTLHPITIAISEISAIFEKIGFIRMSYPEVDYEYFAFEALNMPATHAARDDFETTFLNAPHNKTYGRMVLTPHTSNGQVREMLRVKNPPIRMINIGKCYRPNWDPTHTPMFHQFEGLCVDKDITIAHLKGTLDYFVKEYFGKDTMIRLRPHHFQFTEPSFEVDITCTVCKGSSMVNGNKCKICKSGWLELGGTGMTHPNVLSAGKIDPKIYSGWAFGFGIERVIMMKYGIDDIRNYYSGDVRFLNLF